MVNNRRIVIFGGGTVEHITPHFALTAPAHGATAKKLHALAQQMLPKLDSHLFLTKQAGGSLETSANVAAEIDRVVADPLTKVVILSTAFCDWRPTQLVLKDKPYTIGKYAPRLESKNGPLTLQCEATPKVLPTIRATRKDIFLVGFKTTSQKSPSEQYAAGLKLLKQSSANLIFCNDVVTRLNMIITPEESRYSETFDREAALASLISMVRDRSNLTFTQSTVIAGDPVPWSSSLVPESLRTVVDFCIKQNAYKPVNGATAGHFAVRIDDTNFLTSIRKTDFNKLAQVGLVHVKTDGPDTVLAYGAKPSVGGQSQRIVFKQHPGFDCIVHFHCPIKPGSKVPVVSQREFECGSHECGTNTSKGLAQFGNLKAVYLDNHGPNILFNRNIDPAEVINFIVDNFDLSQKTGGLVV